MHDHRDQILMDLDAHEHRFDLRYHAANSIYDPDQGDYDKETTIEEDDYYLEKILFPSISPTMVTAPAFSTFEYTDNGELTNLEITYL